MKNTGRSVDKTLYIPLYSKSFVSKRSLFLNDETSEKIWEAEGFKLKGKAKSKNLAYYLGMRSAVFDGWLENELSKREESVVIHIGCGLDSRHIRVKTPCSELSAQGWTMIRRRSASTCWRRWPSSGMKESWNEKSSL